MAFLLFMALLLLKLEAALRFERFFFARTHLSFLLSKLPLGRQRLLGFCPDAGAFQKLLGLTLAALGTFSCGAAVFFDGGAEGKRGKRAPDKVQHLKVARLCSKNSPADAKRTVRSPLDNTDLERVFKENGQCGRVHKYPPLFLRKERTTRRGRVTYPVKTGRLGYLPALTYLHREARCVFILAVFTCYCFFFLFLGNEVTRSTISRTFSVSSRFSTSRM